MKRSDKKDILLLAADSGGTKTDWFLLDCRGKTVKKCTTAGVAALHEGLMPVTERINEARILLGNPDIKLIYFSLGGPNTGEVERALQRVWQDIPSTVEREASGALIASCRKFLHCDGAVLGGTGVTAMGFDRNGKCRYAEGWGPVFGDAGSGGGIGLLTVQTFLRGVDGTVDSGRLKEIFYDMYADLPLDTFAGRMELKRRINELDRRALAALAPETAALAEEQDAAAMKIISVSAANMAQLAAAVAPENGRILMLGGLFKLGESYRKACHEALKELRQDCSWYYDERISMGKLVCARALQLAGCEITSTIWEEIIK